MEEIGKSLIGKKCYFWYKAEVADSDMTQDEDDLQTLEAIVRIGGVTFIQFNNAGYVALDSIAAISVVDGE